ncbi:hypothetical protein [Pseudonocardia sp. KRD291]|uniref:type IV toxin-antitoxin system AbiEi family antitoxin domain-containing protein n=1 Tax=Pseudonocardia sp. KRD291 TaxID=2792007 RepID=UPI001C49CCE0|nr:hypothetical protein [Pseudonocardia sp. KRD291]MBW0103387.1 hypothetical protein [Pseudonocardia sp. KRD291]
MDWIRGDAPVGRAELVAGGVSDAELRRAHRDGTVLRPCRGAYLAVDDDRAVDPVWRYTVRVRAVAAHLSSDAVVSHQSAAALHGLWLWKVPLDRVHVVRDRDHGGRRTRSLHVHPAPLAPDEIVEVQGLAVTSVARTVADLARTVPFEQAVVAADSALRPGREGLTVTRPDLLTAVRDGRGRTGNAAAERVARFADGAATGVPESRSRVAVHRAGLPPPVQQRHVHDGFGGWLATVDFWWDGAPSVVGEFDGKAKYGRSLRAGRSEGDAVFEEKVREDLLRAENLAVVRWTWRDLDDFAPTARRLAAALRIR